MITSLLGSRGAAVFLIFASIASSDLSRAQEIRIAAIGDDTRSARNTSTPPLRPEHLESLIEAIRGPQGGTLAVWVIRATDTGGLLRLEIPAGTPEPVPPSRDLGVIQLRDSVRAYNIRKKAWHAAEAERLAEVDRRITAFRAELPNVLGEGTQAEPASAVGAGLRRVDVFFREEPRMPKATICRYALVASDLTSTVKESHYELKTPLTAVAWAFKGDPPPYRIPGARQFEAIEAAGQWLAATISQCSGPHP